MNRPVLRNLVKSHSRDADEDVVVFVAGETSGEAADVSENLLLLVVRCEETNDVALPAAAIELVMPVKDDVFRPFDGTEADQFDIVQTIVNGVRRARAFRSRRAGRQTEIGWRHIDLGEQLVSVFEPANVGENGDQQDRAEHHRSAAAVKTDADDAVGHDQHCDGADYRFHHRPAAAAEAVASKHSRGDGYDFEPCANLGAGAVGPRGIEDAAQAAEHARQNIDAANDATNGNSHVVSGATDPPTARMRQPGRVRLKTKWSSSATPR